MHELYSSFVLGYHGCERSVAERILSGARFQKSRNNYDWLGPGVYFWENDPHRGLQFAVEKAARRKTKLSEPAVVGAVIELGRCLDLTSSNSLAYVKRAYETLASDAAGAGEALPVNSNDLLRRELDCAVVNRLHELNRSADVESIQTVKGVFVEGQPLYPGAGIHEKTHVQIAVVDSSLIKGVFRWPWPT